MRQTIAGMILGAAFAATMSTAPAQACAVTEPCGNYGYYSYGCGYGYGTCGVRERLPRPGAYQGAIVRPVKPWGLQQGLQPSHQVCGSPRAFDRPTIPKRCAFPVVLVPASPSVPVGRSVRRFTRGISWTPIQVAPSRW